MKKKKSSSLSLSHLAVLGGCNFLHAVNTNSMQYTLIQLHFHLFLLKIFLLSRRQLKDRANGQGVVVGGGVANKDKKFHKCWYKLELVWDFCLLKFPAFFPKLN